MGKLKEFAKARPVVTSVVLWVIAIVFTGLCLLWQDTTGPTYPVDVTIPTAKGPVHVQALRSETIGTKLKIMFLEPVPAGVTGFVTYRIYTTNDAWKTVAMNAGDFSYSIHGSTTKVKGFGAELPSLDKRAGKYEYFVYIDDGSAAPISVTGVAPIYARYKGDVPLLVLAVHVFVIFLSMLFAVRTVLEALIDGNFKWMMWATIVTLVLGAFVLGPLVQWYAFRVWWSGFPLGGDWTDNKVVYELLAWLVAAGFNWGKRRNRWIVAAAGVVTFAVYFIPHSIFGSEYNYSTGSGHGTAG